MFSFIIVESVFKMASIQVLFISISLCVTTLTDPSTWTVTGLYVTGLDFSVHEMNAPFILKVLKVPFLYFTSLK